MTELTSKQEDFILESGLERAREKREVKEVKQCEICKGYFPEEELDLVKMSDDPDGIGYESVWCCRDCEENMKEMLK